MPGFNENDAEKEENEREKNAEYGCKGEGRKKIARGVGGFI